MWPVVAGFLFVFGVLYFSFVLMFFLTLAVQAWPLTLGVIALVVYVRRARGCNRDVSVL